MTVTSGFFNAINHDRRYNALEMGEIFDGIIEDGVYETLYNCFRVRPNSNGLAVQVDTGRAWFNHTWIKNDNLFVLSIPEPEVMFSRMDAVVIEVNHTDPVRKSFIRIVKGTPSSDPQKPTLMNTDSVHQHPLAYVIVKPDATEITRTDIINVVGTKECPFVTGVISAMDIDMFMDLWQAQYEEWVYEHANEFLDWLKNFRGSLEEDTLIHMGEKIADLYNIIRTLARERAIYYPILDVDYDPILDNYGNEIIGGIKFPISFDEACGCSGSGSGSGGNIEAISREAIDSLFSS